MKKTILSALFLGILFTACKNQSDKQEKTETEIEKITDIKTNSESGNDKKKDFEKGPYAFDYIYKSNNGEIVDATFFAKNDKMYIKVKRSDKTELILEQTTAWAKGAEYEKDNYKWTSQKNNATFSDGKETMKLIVVSPLQYRFTNDKKDITIIYFSKNGRMFVTIKSDNKPEITLEQTTAWAKGAEYGKGSILWHAQGNNGTLVENGTKTKFTQKNQ